MKIKIYRYDDKINTEPHFDEYDIPIETSEKNYTIMDLLDYISLNYDSSISYYKHSVCNHGVCGRCGISVNGKTKLACLEIANDYEELILEPIKTKEVVKDLVTR